MNKTFKFLIILMVIATMGLIFNASIESVAMSEEEKVNMDLSRINVPDQAIISFPVVIHSVFNNQIEWESSDHDVLDFMDGWFVLTRSPEVDHTVTLTVTVTSSADSEVSGTKAFEVFVPKGVTSTKNYTITYENVTEEEIDQANLRETYRLGEATFDLGVPTREGYDFLGWYLEDTFETEVTEVKVGSMKDLTFFAKWEVSIASYKVEHYQQGLDGFYALVDTDNLSSKPGTTVSATPKDYVGFEVNPNEEGSNLSDTVKADGSTTLKVFYERTTYKITIMDGETELQTFNFLFEQEVTGITEPTKVGYKLSWDKAIPETMPAENLVINAIWTPETVNYTVQYFLEKVEGGYDTSSETFQALTDAQVTVQPKEIEKFTFDQDNPNNVLQGTVQGDGSLVLKLYYKRNVYALSFDSVGGNLIDTINAKVDELVNLPTPTKEGYEFNGWYDGDELIESPFAMPNKAVELVAHWKPALVKYTVKYYLESLTDGVFDYHTLIEKTALTGTTVSAEEIEAEGFSAPATMPSDVVLPDGSLVLEVYYTRNTYTITIDENGGDEVADIVAKFGATINAPTLTKTDYRFLGWVFSDESILTFPSTMPAFNFTATANWTQLPTYKVTFDAQNGTDPVDVQVIEGHKVVKPANPTKLGYTFVDWYLDQEGTTVYNFDTEVTSDILLYAKWDANEVDYVIQHIRQDLFGNYILVDSIPSKALTDSTVSVTPRTYTGFTYDGEIEGTILEETVKADGSTVLKVFYTRNSYTVTFIDEAENREESYEILYEDVILEPSWERAGYELSWEPIVTNMPAHDLEIYAQWTAIEVDYKVIHYLEDVNGIFFEDVTESFSEYTGEEVFAEEKEYDYYTFDSSIDGSVLSGIVKGDGSLVLKLYYTRNVYTITINANDGNDVPNITSKHGLPINEPYMERLGYVFDGWTKDGLDFTFPTTMPTEDITIVAQWKPVLVNYTVKYYFQNLELTDYILDDNLTENQQGYTDSVVNAEIKAVPGFTFNESESMTEALVLADGSLVLVVKYTRNSYTITINENGGSDTEDITALFGAPISAPTLTRTDYDFVKWTFSDASITDFPNTMPAANLIATAVWELTDEKKVEYDIEAIIEQYQHILTGDITELENLLLTGLNGSSIRWESDNTAVFVNPVDGSVSIIQSTTSDEVVFLTVFVSSNNVIDAHTFTFTVPMKEENALIFATDLFISEYAEGTGNNKYIEIFNGTGSTVNLIGYSIKLYANGATTPNNTYNFSGTLENNSVIIIFNSSASALIKDKGGIGNAVANFNGDDAIGLYKNDVLIDIIGTIGDDPGSEWKEDGKSTLDSTLIRKSTISKPNVIFNFNEWEGMNVDYFEDLGTHDFRPEPAIEYTITFNGNGADGGSINSFTSSNPFVLPTDGFTKEGYTLIGWTDDSESKTVKKYELGHLFTPTENTTLFAVWFKDVLVTYDYNGGEGTIDSEVYNGLTAIQLPSATRDGYNFLGWADSADAEEATYLLDSSFVPVTDVTLYAVWAPYPIVSFDPNGGEGEISPLTFTGSAIELPTSGFTKEGYTLIGWTDDAENKTVKKYELGDLLTPTENTTLFAVWKEDSSGGVEELIYSTGFETGEGYNTSTTYNNTTPKENGPENYQWLFLSGTPSTNKPISGSSSAQMRVYNSTGKLMGSITTLFKLDDVTKVEFKAKKSSTINVIVSYSFDGVNWIGEKTFSLTDSAETYTYTINVTGSIYLKFEQTSDGAHADKAELYIDDVKVFGLR